MKYYNIRSILYNIIDSIIEESRFDIIILVSKVLRLLYAKYLHSVSIERYKVDFSKGDNNESRYLSRSLSILIVEFPRNLISISLYLLTIQSRYYLKIK